MEKNWMTVEEFASAFRTTTTTVYRWLKQGKLHGAKIGKEWRLSLSEMDMLLRVKKTAAGEDGSLIWNRLNANEHLMVIAESKSLIYKLESSFFSYAVSNNKRVMKGCWWQDPDEIEEIYTRLGLDVESLTKEGLFKIIDFNWIYRKYGIGGPVEAWRNEIVKSRRNTFWASGAPSVSCFDGNPKTMLHFESRLNEVIKDMPVIGICPYSADEFEGSSFKMLHSLICAHSGVVFYDSENPVLMRR